MPAYSKAKIKRLLKKSDTAPTDDAKGDAFEELFCYLFGKIPGITHIERNELSIFSSEEIDAAAWNEQDPRGLKSLNTPIPIECKSSMHPISSKDVDWFISKIRRRRLDFGILVVAKGISGDADKRTGAHDVVSGAIQEGIRVIVITRAELEALISSEELVQLIKVKICKLVVKRTASP
ncbi:MAG: hypothetical protein WBX00_37270 [Isosphaeraceae bacterium]